MRTSPPMALTVLRRVESSGSLRFSSRETLSCVPSFPASLRELASLSEIAQADFLCDDLGRTVLDFFALGGIQLPNDFIHVDGHSYVCLLVRAKWASRCNSLKADGPAPDFLLSLFREGRSSTDELAAGLRALKALASRNLRPQIEQIKVTKDGG